MSTFMKIAEQNPGRSMQSFVPDPDAVYTIDAVTRLARVPRRKILIYYKHGLVAPVADPASSGYYFDAEAIRALRLIEDLRTRCGVNLAGARMMLELMDEVEQLRSELRFLRQ